MSNQSYQDYISYLMTSKGMSPQEATIEAQKMNTQTDSSMASMASKDLANMTTDMARKIGETYPFSDEQKVYENMQALGSKMGKGTQTGGKYGVFVGDPLGAFAGGAMQTYGSLSALQNALRAKEIFGEYGASKAGKKDSSTVDPAYDMQAGIDTGLSEMAARNNARFNKPQQLPKPSMMPAQTYPAKQPVTPNAQPYPVEPTVSTPSGSSSMPSSGSLMLPKGKPPYMSDEQWARINALQIDGA